MEDRSPRQVKIETIRIKIAAADATGARALASQVGSQLAQRLAELGGQGRVQDIRTRVKAPRGAAPASAARSVVDGIIGNMPGRRG